jgi:hypothetical protein
LTTTLTSGYYNLCRLSIGSFATSRDFQATAVKTGERKQYFIPAAPIQQFVIPVKAKARRSFICLKVTTGRWQLQGAENFTFEGMRSTL